MSTYPQIDLSAWKQVGEGGNGAAYVNDAEPGVLLKVNTLDTTEQTIQEEFYTTKAVLTPASPVPRCTKLWK